MILSKQLWPVLGKSEHRCLANLFFFSASHSLCVEQSEVKMNFYYTNIFHDEEKSGEKKEYEILNEVG